MFIESRLRKQVFKTFIIKYKLSLILFLFFFFWIKLKKKFFTMKKSFFLHLIIKIKDKVMGQNPKDGTSSPDNTVNEKKDFQNLIDECKRLNVENKSLKNEIESLKTINDEMTKSNRNLVRK